MVWDLLYPSRNTIFQLRYPKRKLFTILIYFLLLSTIPYLIKYPGFEDYAENYLSGEVETIYLPTFTSYDNYTDTIVINNYNYTFETTPQRLWDGHQYGSILIPIFFINDDVGWLRDIELHHYWLIFGDVEIQGNQTTIGPHVQSFGSPWVIQPGNVYWDCGGKIDIYLGITYGGDMIVAGNLNRTILCW